MTPDTNLSPQQPLDDIVAHLLSTIHRKGRGFTLGVVDGDDGNKTIEVKESLPPHDEWQAPADYRGHQIDDTDSFITYAKKYGDASASLVMYNESGATLTINELPERGQREIIRMPFVESQDWQQWSAMLGDENTHKELLQFLMSHEHNLSDIDVLKSMQSMKINSTVNVESDIKDDGKSVGLMIKTNAGEELKKFPKAFDIHLPVLQQDGYAGTEAKATIRLEIILPDDPKKGPSFTLWCSVWPQIKQARVRAEGESIAEALGGWTVVQGSHSTKTRTLGK